MYDPDVHKRKSLRLKEYDYSAAGYYFIAICTNNRVCHFGDIIAGVMHYSAGGFAALKYALEIPTHYPDVVLCEHVVLPNHVHLILEILPNTTPVHEKNDGSKNEFQKIILRSAGAVVRGFKIAVTEWFRQNSMESDIWQRSFHDHIISDQEGYVTIANYINNNIQNWEDDKFFRKQDRG